MVDVEGRFPHRADPTVARRIEPGAGENHGFKAEPLFGGGEGRMHYWPPGMEALKTYALIIVKTYVVSRENIHGPVFLVDA